MKTFLKQIVTLVFIKENKTFWSDDKGLFCQSLYSELSLLPWQIKFELSCYNPVVRPWQLWVTETHENWPD